MCRGIAALGLALVACPPLPPAGDASGGTSTTAATTTPGADEPGPVTIPCEVDEDCPDRCHDGACVDGCSPEAPCPEGLVCTDDACIAPLPAPPPCPTSVIAAPSFEVTLPGDKVTRKVGAADIDGDGAPELLAERAGGLWWVRRDDLQPVKFFAGEMTGRFDTNLGDVDGDGHLDVLARSGDVVLLGDGAGGFTESPGPEPGPLDGALGDIDEDGRADIVGFIPTCLYTLSACIGDTPGLWVWQGSGWASRYHGPISNAPANMLVAPLLPGHRPVGVFEGAADLLLSTFTGDSGDASSIIVSNSEWSARSSLVVVRRPDDDRAELMRVSTRENAWTWGARIRASAESTDGRDQWAIPGRYTQVAVGDIDQDGSDDLVLAGPDIRVLLDREEEPTGACVVPVPTAGTAPDVALADLDGDGAPELITGAEPGIVVFALQLSP